MTQCSTALPPLAAIDIGTNTIRLLVARPTWEGGVLGLQPLASETATVRLGYGVERTGRFDPARLDSAVETVGEYQRLAAEFGASPILVAATSATRDATNGAELGERIAATCGLTLQIIAGEREAALTFAGATAGESLDGTLLVADLGGGSLELIVSRDGGLTSVVSLQVGSGRLAERHIPSDPPMETEILAAAHNARAAITPHTAVTPLIERAILVGGTAKALAILVPAPDASPTLTTAQLMRATALLTSAKSAHLAAQYDLDPERVRTLAAGAAIIGAILAAYQLDVATIGSGGIREGLLLDYLRNTASSEGIDTDRMT